MIIFNHAQPALLYICPGLLLGSIGVAFARQDLKSLHSMFLSPLAVCAGAETSQLLTYSLPGSPEAKLHRLHPLQR